MKVLVIGATGQTGRHAVTLLLARGDEVTAFARNPSAITERGVVCVWSRAMRAIRNRSIARWADKTPCSWRSGRER